MIQSRPQFGYIGALLVWGVALIAYIGFNAFNQILAAQTVHVPVSAAIRPLTMLVFTLLVGVAGGVGYDLIHLAQRWVAYVLIAALLVFTVAVLARGASAGGRIAICATFGRAVSGAILRGRLLPDRLVHLCVGLFALPAARRGVGASFWWTYLGAFVGRRPG